MDRGNGNFWRWCAMALLAVALLFNGRSIRADGIAPGHVLARVLPGVDIQRLARDFKSKVLDNVPGTAIYSLALPTGSDEADFAVKLAADTRRVRYAEPDVVLNTPEIDGDPFHLPFDYVRKPFRFSSQSAYSQVNVSVAPLLPTGAVNLTGVGNTPLGAGVIVAVLDTGLVADHPALQGHVLTGWNALRPGRLPTEAWDGTTNDAVGHGTMIAGVIARLAPAAKILPVRVLNGDGAGTMLNVAKGVHFAIRSGARVLNMSFGTMQKSSVMNDALDAAELAEVVLVAAAGNQGWEQKQYPAAGNGALAVGSVEADLKKSSYSNYGSFVRVVAPGSNIGSTYVDGGYASWSGTSFAVPFVSAEAALLFSARPALTGSLVKDIIRSTAEREKVDKANPAYKGKLGKGLINIGAALARVR